MALQGNVSGISTRKFAQSTAQMISHQQGGDLCVSAQGSKECAEDGCHEMQVKTGSWYEPVQSMCGNIAGIISNPPYIPHSQMRKLQASTLFPCCI